MAANIVPEVFVIEAASQEEHQLNDEPYVIRTQLNNGQWTMAPTDIMGIYDVRWFLNDNGVNDKDIVFAIEELSRRRWVTVNKRSRNAA
jgi:hypothetical protein